MRNQLVTILVKLRVRDRAAAVARALLSDALRGATAFAEVLPAACLVRLDAAHVLGGRDPCVRDFVAEDALMKRGVLPADSAHRCELRHVLGKRHKRRKGLEGAAVERHAETGDDHRHPVEHQPAHRRDELRPEELAFVDPQQVQLAIADQLNQRLDVRH